jgi:hypothetical protein
MRLKWEIEVEKCLRNKKKEILSGKNVAWKADQQLNFSLPVVNSFMYS